MNLTQAKPEMADMQTVVIIGSSQTKALIQNGKTLPIHRDTLNLVQPIEDGICVENFCSTGYVRPVNHNNGYTQSSCDVYFGISPAAPEFLATTNSILCFLNNAVSSLTVNGPLEILIK